MLTKNRLDLHCFLRAISERSLNYSTVTVSVACNPKLSQSSSSGVDLIIHLQITELLHVSRVITDLFYYFEIT